MNFNNCLTKEERFKDIIKNLKVAVKKAMVNPITKSR